ncbi:Uncharacterised protein [Mycobacteroides abscessus subsp. abscessus]|nr:Uncharacterised protein [Mycobacteroides abscessus subsp. abscessus]
MSSASNPATFHDPTRPQESSDAHAASRPDSRRTRHSTARRHDSAAVDTRARTRRHHAPAGEEPRRRALPRNLVAAGHHSGVLRNPLRQGHQRHLHADQLDDGRRRQQMHQLHRTTRRDQGKSDRRRSQEEQCRTGSLFSGNPEHDQHRFVPQLRDRVGRGWQGSEGPL